MAGGCESHHLPALPAPQLHLAVTLWVAPCPPTAPQPPPPCPHPAPYPPHPNCPQLPPSPPHPCTLTAPYHPHPNCPPPAPQPPPPLHPNCPLPLTTLQASSIWLTHWGRLDPQHKSGTAFPGDVYSDRDIVNWYFPKGWHAEVLGHPCYSPHKVWGRHA